MVRRLGFNRKRSPDNGDRGFIWDNKIVERNLVRYGLAKPPKPPDADTPGEVSKSSNLSKLSTLDKIEGFVKQTLQTNKQTNKQALV